MTETDCIQPQFKKRKKKKRNAKLREPLQAPIQTATAAADKSDDKNPNDDEAAHSDDANEDDDLSFLKDLQETKTFHKLQFDAKNKGLVFEENHEFTSSGLENPDNFRHDPSKDFGESFQSEKAQEDKLKTQREEWVDKQMRARKLEQGRILPQHAKSPPKQHQHEKNNKLTLKEELYALDEKLIMPLTSAKDNDEAGERWLAGMCEYELPLDFKLKNIKQTEDAKKKLLQPKAKRDKILDIPRNFNQDFTTHHYDRVKSAEHKRKLQETQQRLSMQREKKRRRVMGPNFYHNGN
mmetsp:Transcript_70733/g.112406  ORF Transcript_70733/g.112406 Transcript_70733/m.112406 type:complete len:295 (+) Transcript_70733:72-956(+)